MILEEILCRNEGPKTFLGFKHSPRTAEEKASWEEKTINLEK